MIDFFQNLFCLWNKNHKTISICFGVFHNFYGICILIANFLTHNVEMIIVTKIFPFQSYQFPHTQTQKNLTK